MSRHHVAALLLGFATCLTSACGLHTAAVAGTQSQSGFAVASNEMAEQQAFAGSPRSSQALSYANVVARTLDAHAAFIGLVGTQIGPDGTPGPGGSWVIQYLGGAIAASEGKTANPYMPNLRRITVTLTGDGKAHTRSTSQAGMPMGVSFVQSPAPAVDSDAVFRAFYANHAGAEQAPLARMSLSGTLSLLNFGVLIWRVESSDDDNTNLSFALNADTGALLDQASETTAAVN